MIAILLALASAGFKESRRNRVTVVVVAFALVLILMTTVVLNTTAFTLDRVVTDFGLGVMSLLLVSLAMYLSVGLLSREVERRTIFLVVSRPLSRATFVAGRFLGIVATLTVMEAAMVVLYASQLWLFDVAPTSAMVAAVVGLWIELLVIAALGLFLSSFAGQLVAAICLVGVYLVGHWSQDLWAQAERQPAPVMKALLRAAYYLVPNLDRFDFRVEAAYAQSVEVGTVLPVLAFGLAWTVALVTAAAMVLGRRDFK
jgi:ABC-type transport system involved in multi-copper enzyme maturation permease subunit